jgi:hypothetical protein
MTGFSGQFHRNTYLRRLTIFNYLNKSPDSGPSRSLIIASSGYGLTQGSYAAEQIKLLERGQAIVERNDAQAKLDAVLGNTIFSEFFIHYRNATVPSANAAIDYLKTLGLTEERARSCLDVLLKNGEEVGLIQDISGVKRIVSVENALEKLLTTTRVSKPAPTPVESVKSELAPSISMISPALQTSPVQPSVHIDIQIHISADAKPEQIEKIFESMAKYLYNKS